MKKYIYLFLFVLVINKANAQLIIATDNNNVKQTESTLIQFEDGYTKGIILPANTQVTTNPTNGSFTFDQSDRKVKMYENDQWVSLTPTGDSGAILTINSNDNGEGVIVGAETSTAEGVLVLESDDRALVLPRIDNPVVNVNSPYPGMIAYDTTSKTIAIFDGKLWSFWK